MDAHSLAARAGGTAASAGRAPLPPRLAALAVSLRDLLFNAALLAAARGMDAEALAIAPAVVALGIDQNRLDIAIAMVKLEHGDSEGSLTVLERGVLRRDPGSEMALAVQAAAWRVKGLPQWRTQANALLSTSANPLVRRIARAGT